MNHTPPIATTFALLAIMAGGLPAAPLDTAFTYQGLLLNDGQPAEGLYDLQFALFDLESGGSPIAGPVTNSAVGVANGLVTTLVDFGDDVSLGEARWLEIAVRPQGASEFSTLTPRQPLTPTPYALHAASANAAATALTAASAGSVAANAVANASLQVNAVTTDKIADGTVAATDVNATSFNTTFWRTTGNTGTTPGTHFLGTSDEQPLEFRIRGERVLRLEPAGDSLDEDALPDGAANLVSGAPVNWVSPDVAGATISGGGATRFDYYNPSNRVASDYATVGGGLGNGIMTRSLGATISGGWSNHIHDDASAATIGGGWNNAVHTNAFVATIAGGLGNQVSGLENTIGGGAYNRSAHQSATVAGGNSNAATNFCATVPGGRNNIAGGGYSFAAGRQAQALHDGAFVWADSNDADFASTKTNQFLIRASGGLGLNTANPVAMFDVASGDALVRGRSNFLAGTDARLNLGDLNNYVRAVWGEGLRLGVWQGADALAVNNGGNVGIGTTNPTARLHVAGTVKATGFSGSGSGLTDLSGSALLPGSIGEWAIAGDSITSAHIIDGTISSEDATPNAFWRATGNTDTVPGTHFLGTTDDQPLEFRVNNHAGLRLGFSYASGISMNLVGGYWSNRISQTATGSTIAGGGGQDYDLIADRWVFYPNEVDSSYAAIGGGYGNSIGTGSEAATIAGGRHNTASAEASTVGGGYSNTASGQRATVSGGNGQIASGRGSTIAGGVFNLASGGYSSVGGGFYNSATNHGATVPGGEGNLAGGNYGLAAGRRAKALHQGAFVWADSTDADFASTTSNQFNLRASGGVRIDTGPAPGIALNAADHSLLTCGWNPFSSGSHSGAGRWGLFMEPHTLTLGMPALGGKNVQIAKYHENSTYTSLATFDQFGNLTIEGTLIQLSDRNAKEHFSPVDCREVLDKVVALPLLRWNFKADGTTQHLGPMAQDFHAAFGLGADDQHIATVDADGVALAAIQGLNQKLELQLKEKETRIAVLEQKLAALEQLLNLAGK